MMFIENLKARIHEWFNLPYNLSATISGEGPAIVMLHGIATSSESWSQLLPLINTGFKCITIDLLGFGNSPKPDWYSYTPEEHIRNIHHTIKKQHINGPIILVGHSMGSLLALHYAAKYPAKIGRLVLLSPPIYFTNAESNRAKKAWRETLYSRAYKYVRSHKKFTLRGSKGLKALVLRNNPFHVNETTWLSFSKSLEECIEKQNVVKDMEQINCPINIFYGIRDGLLITSNIRSLKLYKNIAIKPLRASHLINVSYATAVANFLLGSLE